jgi:flagellar motor switch protein FliG
MRRVPSVGMINTTIAKPPVPPPVPLPVNAPPRRLKGAEKAAALILAMGKDNASRLLAHFGEEEIRLIARTACDLGSIPQATLDSIADEFIGQASAGGVLRGSSEEVQALLEKILPPSQVMQIMSDVRARMNEAVWPRLGELPSQVLAQFLSKEHPQIISFVLSKLPITLSAEVVALYPNQLRNETVRRMLSTKLVTQPALRLLEQVLRDDLLLKVAKASGQDSHARIAKIINKLDRRTMDDVLESLAANNPKAAEIVRSLLFTFDDIAKLPSKTRTVLFETIEAERLIPALNGASGELKEFILTSVPMRTRKMIEQELAAAPALTEKEREKARRAIADFALQLAEQGVITLDIGQEE